MVRSKQFKRSYVFGSFHLDPEQKILLREGQPVPLAPKVFETLLLLVEQSGRVVGKEEMMNVLWPDRYVEEANLTQNIFMLRKLLSRGQGEEQYIETIPKRGYRFVNAVKEILEEVSPSVVEESSEGRRGFIEGEPSDYRNRAITSLAVLPIVNETDDPDVEFFSDGITESLINILSRISKLHLVARSVVFSYKGQVIEPRKVGAELGVDTVLSSRILLSHNKMIIRTELIEVANGWQIWGEQYDRPLSAILTVENELSTCISERLLSGLTEEEKKRLTKRYTQSAEAYQLYLKGRFCRNQQTEEGFKKAIESFEKAVEIYPDYALAQSALADSYVAFDFYGVIPPWESSMRAKSAAMKALAIDETLAEAHTSLACVKMMFERDWSGAEREFRRAIELEPKYAHAHKWYSHFLMAMGSIEQSFTESRIALALDPFDDEINQYLAWHHIYARHFDRAINQLEKTLEKNPDFFLARVTLGLAYVHRGEFSTGLIELQNASLLERPSLLSAFIGHAYALSGQREEALKILEELKELSKQSYVPPYAIGLIYTGLGDNAGAFEWFRKAYEAQNAWLSWLKVAPEFDNLRSDPGFADLLLRLNLVP
jgi:DNA-binding winged helix-turn-helix (wHTH) protein/TolB-like protein